MNKYIHFILYIPLYILSLLPIRILYYISDILYLFVFYLIRYRRDISFRNLKKSFPEKSSQEINKIQKNFYQHFCDLLIESIKSISANKNFFKKRIKFKNLEKINHHDSFIVAVSHYGNWEWGLSSMSLSFNKSIIGLFQELNNNFFNKIIKKSREKFGAKLLDINDLLKYINRNKNFVIGIIGDQSPQKNKSNLWMNFLNQETLFHHGTEKISKKYNLPIYFCDMEKTQRGYYDISIEILCENTKTSEYKEITSVYLQRIEKQIKKNPEFWLWTHNRWKHQK